MALRFLYKFFLYPVSILLLVQAVSLPLWADDFQLLNSSGQTLFSGPSDSKAYVEACTKDKTLNMACLHKLGSAFIAEKKTQEAIHLYRLYLALDPGYNPARLNLGLAYFLAGNYESARYHLESALASRLPPVVEAKTRSILNKIQGGKTWGLSAFFGTNRNTNINRASDFRTVILAGASFELAKPKSGTEIEGGVSLSYNPQLNETTRVNVKTGLTIANTWNDNDRADKTLTLSLGLTSVVSNQTTSFGVALSRTDIEGEAYNRGFGPFLKLSRQINNRLSASISGSFTRILGDKDHPLLKSISSDPEKLDGWNAALSTSFSYHKSNRLVLNGGFDFNASIKSTSDHWHGYGVSGGFRYLLPENFVIEPGLSLYQKRYQDVDPVFEIYRRDNLFQASVRITNGTWTFLGMAPYLDYTYKHNKSNLKIYTYTSHDVGGGLTYNF